MSYNTVDFVFTESQERKAILDFISSIGIAIDSLSPDDIKNASLEDLKALAISILNVPTIDDSQMSLDDYFGYKQMSIYDPQYENGSLISTKTQVKFHPTIKGFVKRRKNK